MQKYKIWLLDFDYTLVDSSHAVHKCINHALDNMGYQNISYEQAAAYIGYTLREVFEMITGDPEIEKADHFRKIFKEMADVLENEQTHLFPFVPDVINKAHNNNIRLGIVSTKNRFRIEHFLKQHHLLDAFEHIVGGEDVSKHKPNPEPLYAGMEKFGLTQEHFLYSGDSIVDARAAESAGVPFAAVLSGVTKREAFKPFKTVEIAKDVSGVSIVL